MQYGRILLRDAVPSLFLPSASPNIRAEATIGEAISKFLLVLVRLFIKRVFLTLEFLLQMLIEIGVLREFSKEGKWKSLRILSRCWSMS